MRVKAQHNPIFVFVAPKHDRIGPSWKKKWVMVGVFVTVFYNRPVLPDLLVGPQPERTQ
jgi:hypothetical protein